MMDRMSGWRLEHTYAALPQIFHATAMPTAVREPRLVVFNRPLAIALGLDAGRLDGPEGAAIFAGNAVPDGASPIAQAYAGHQFGHFTALGDGRAILLGEQITPAGRARRHPVERAGADAVLDPRRRARRARADAARIHHQRGDARAGHPDDAEPRRGRDRRIGLSRRSGSTVRC
jgi:hypothetical protein